MARGGITQTEVEKARDALLARGEHPSIDAVRIELGNTGSKTTIHRHLQALEGQEGRRLDDEALLSEGLRSTVASLARQLREEAQAIVEAAETGHRAEREALQARIDALEGERTQAVAQAESLGAQLEGTRSTLSETQKELNREQIRTKALETETAGLLERLEERSRHLESLEQKHRQARDALEHYRQLAKEQRDQERRDHEAQVRQVQSEMRRKDQLLAAKQDDLTRISSDNARISTELGESLRRERGLQDGLERERQRVETLVADRARLEAERDSRDAAIREASAAYLRLDEAHEQLKADLAKRIEQLHGLEGQLRMWATVHALVDESSQQPQEEDARKDADP